MYRKLATALLFVAATAALAENRQGKVLLLSNCPGDTVATGEVVKLSPILAAILTPLIAGFANQGVKAVGANLQEAAQEAQVDVFGIGDHFYVVDAKDTSKEPTISLNYSCVIVTTKGTKPTKRSLARLARDYQPAQFKAGEAKQLEKWLPANPQPLLNQLMNVGYTDTDKPALLVVLDIEFATTKADARLVPRYVVMDHSIREKVDDSKSRDITFEIALSAPGGATPFGKTVIKFDALNIDSPRTRQSLDLASPQKSGLALTGQWFPVPALSDLTKTRVSNTREAKVQQKVESQTWTLARAAAIGLGSTTLPAECPGMDAVLKPWSEAYAELAKEKAKPSQQQDAKRIAMLSEETTFFAACDRYHKSVATAARDALKDGEEFAPFDLAVSVKEFRERPAAKFFGSVFGDSTVQTGLTTALVNAIDPATREAAEQKAAAEKIAERVAYENALLLAEQAILAYESAKDDERTLKYLDMESKKRAANRLADQLNLARPYPGSGVWFTG